MTALLGLLLVLLKIFGDVLNLQSERRDRHGAHRPELLFIAAVGQQPITKKQ